MSVEDDSPGGASADRFHRLLQPIRQLEAEGLERSSASRVANFEERLESCWQETWGDELPFLIYGDFQPPEAEIRFEELGITLYREDMHKKWQNDTAVRGSCVLNAVVRIRHRNMEGILDAIRRINVLLGTFILIGWGNGSCNWWSWVVHSESSAALPKISFEEWHAAIASIGRLPAAVRRRLEAALYWIREPGRSLLESTQNNDLRRFSAYWNAFECVVEAVNLLRPQERLSRNEKQQRLNDYVAERSGKLAPSDIVEMYQRIVNPGFVGKAAHALRVCFGDGADVYMQDCFLREDRGNRLYDIRNAINHGEIDAEDMRELSRVEDRLSRLWIILLGMIGRLVLFSYPLDPNLPGN